jgi:hypothetical protein
VARRDSISTVVARLADVLEQSGETYAFGGAIALAAWSEPRATADVDVVIWVAQDRIEVAIELVRDAGAEVQAEQARQGALERGMFICRLGGVRVDVFVPSIPFYAEAATRRVRTTIAGRSTWVHSAEVLAVFKLLFFRAKDLVDVERMLQVRGVDFDRSFVRAALVDLLGEDERIERWDEICGRVPAS